MRRRTLASLAGNGLLWLARARVWALLLIASGAGVVAGTLVAGDGAGPGAHLALLVGGATIVSGLLLGVAAAARCRERVRCKQAMAAQTAELAEREATLRAFVDNLPGAVAQIAADQPGAPITFVGGEIESMTGLPREEFVGAPVERLLSLVHPDDRRRVATAHARAIENVAAFQIEFRILAPDGSTRWLSERAQPTVDAAGATRTLEGVLIDVTEHKLAQERIVEAEERYRKLVEELPLVVYLSEVLDDGERILYVGPQIESVTGYGTWEWMAPNGLWARVIDEDDLERVLEARRAHCLRGEPFSEEYRITRKDGSRAWVLDEAVIERDEGGRVLASRGYIVDVTARKELEQQLSHQAVHDALTGLANRVLLRDRVTHALERRELHGQAVAVLFIDLDDFKPVNDSLGHRVGDLLLIEAAARLREAIRPGDTPARLGGDELAVLLEECDGIVDANTVAGRIAAALSEPFVLEGSEVVVGASVGIAIEDGHGASADELLQDADVAMYRAKAAGKGRSETYQPAMRAEAVLRFERTTEMRHAIERGEFSLKYQPIVTMESGAVAGLEALVRWEHPRWREMSPGDFIPLAEETGLIISLGEWVLESVCEASKRWTNGQAGRGAGWMSVNVSLRELQEADYATRVAEIIERTGVDPATILFEVTESAVMTDLDGMVDKLERLRSMGARVAVDDFGTGYSSLAHLGRLPVDMVKVAGPFIEGLGRRKSDDELARAILHLGDEVGIETVAEGVQTAAQRDLLVEIGCRFGQGYFFAEPLGEDDVRAMPDVPRLHAA